MSFRLPQLSGKITYNTIETDEPLSEDSVRWRVGEDLLQVEYENNLLLDVGWYRIRGDDHPLSNRDLHGLFFVRGVRNTEWSKLVLEIAARDYEELRVAITVADYYLHSLPN